MKQYDASRQVFEDALEIRHAELDEADDRYSKQQVKSNLAKIRHNISCVNYELGNLEEAKRNCDDAISDQKSIFGFWIFRSMALPRDASKPGFMTMASTMCNKGT
jgi:tetratricopeptide (TPR) repeat protein